MLPEMIVEKDNRLDTSHGLRAPSEPGTAEYKKQLSDMLELCQGAKVSTTGGHPWPTRVIEILKEHAPFDLHDVSFALLKFGFMSWRDCVSFVMDDNCDDFASLVLKYSQAEGVQHSRNRGFIDGDGIGYKRRYIERLGRKSKDSRGSLEKAFDAKYHFKQERPLIALEQALGAAAAGCLVNYVHPGHWSYPAGHGAKFFEVVDLSRDTWDLTEVQDSIILTASYVLAMARSGGGVHFPEDNIASGYLADLTEFESFAA